MDVTGLKPLELLLPITVASAGVTVWLVGRFKVYLDLIPGPLFDPNRPTIRDASINIFGWIINVVVDFAFVALVGIQVSWLAVLLFSVLQQGASNQIYQTAKPSGSSGKSAAMTRRGFPPSGATGP